MRTDLQEAFSQDNLRRAWRWVRSNPEAKFKNYFRGIYRAYSLADEAYLFTLRSRLLSGTFQPSHATKIYLPKPSGLLRNYSLLTVEDQIAYQALVNVIAEKLYPRVRARYHKHVFGHLYAGKASVWFYQKWSTGYRRFNQGIRKAFLDGYVYSATFDLTACYDTMDHAVIEHFLRRLKLSHEFINRLKEWLATWTSTKRKIYQSQGIPQGPLPSGLLSEVVLQHFDSFMGRKNKKIRYFRYVDDIKLFAKSERELRLALVYLDILCKEVGLFPQSSKIRVRKVQDINEELKSISLPPEQAVNREAVNQARVRSRIAELSRNLQIQSETRFKYVLAHAEPHSALNGRLLKLLDRFPQYYPQILSYFSRYEVIPKSVCKALYEILARGDPYFSFQAAILQCVMGRVHRDYKIAFNQHVRRRWVFVKSRQDANDLQQVLLEWQAKERMLQYVDIGAVLKERHLNDWARACFLEHIEPAQIGIPSLEAILNGEVVRAPVDGAVMAAKQILIHGARLTAPHAQVNHVASWGLKIFGHIPVPNRPSLVEKCLEDICNRKVAAFDWRTALGGQHDEVQRLLILAKGYSKTDMSSWANQMDVVHDRILDVLFVHDGGIGGYTLGKIGGALDKNSRFAKKYPRLFQAVNFVHDKRLESSLSHPVTRTTGKPTQHLKFSTLSQARRFLAPGYDELVAAW